MSISAFLFPRRCPFTADGALTTCPFRLSHASHPGPRPAPHRSVGRRRSSARHAPVQVCRRSAQPPAAHGVAATGPDAAGMSRVQIYTVAFINTRTADNWGIYGTCFWTICISGYCAVCTWLILITNQQPDLAFQSFILYLNRLGVQW